MITAKHDGTAPSILAAMRQAAEALQQTDNPFLAEKIDDQVGEYYRAICGLKDDDALEAADEISDQCCEHVKSLKVIPETAAITLTLPGALVNNLQELVFYCGDEDDFDGTSHGRLTVEKLLTLLAEDAGMLVTRLGCWEAGNMGTALRAHGYEF